MYTAQTPLHHILIIVFVVLGIIIGCFIMAVIYQQLQVKRLYRSKIEAEITTLENERKRIAADIHDELGPLLSAAKLKFNQVEDISPGDQQLINQGNSYIDEIISKMREIAKNLMPAVLLFKGPIVAIKEFIEHIVPGNNLAITFEAGQIPELSDFQSLHLFRIIQEIIHNTVKHAGATQLKIVLYTYKNQLVISTVDNGKGFNFKTISKQANGLGIYNIQSRIDMLNGQLQVKSKAGRGTSFYIAIPV